MDTPKPINWQKQLENYLKQKNKEYTGHNTNPTNTTFHASSIGYCKRQLYLKKTNLSSIDKKGLRIVNIGSQLHYLMEKVVQNNTPEHIKSEISMPELEINGIKFTGTADAVDQKNGIIYDFKTRGGWYKFNPPSQRHIDQLQIYMNGFDHPRGQLVYMSRKDMSMKHFPSIEDLGTIPTNDLGKALYVQKNREHVKKLSQKAWEVLELIRDYGIPETEKELNDIIPKCGCYICQNESKELG